jgi:hypothetical protein
VPHAGADDNAATRRPSVTGDEVAVLPLDAHVGALRPVLESTEPQHLDASQRRAA